ncbi:hypothetical protein D3C78_1585830 [compost metagenome]
MINTRISLVGAIGWFGSSRRSAKSLMDGWLRKLVVMAKYAKPLPGTVSAIRCLESLCANP